MFPTGQERKQRSLMFGLVCLGTLIAYSPQLVFAQSQILPDNTLGDENSQVRTDVEDNRVDVIDGGAKRDINLFHSFQEFNIDEGGAAYFINPVGVENILGRVTGSNPSEILGRLGVLGDANLFLLNPNGILFGADASLDIQGSFVATSANAIQFGSQGNFSASSPQTVPLLTVNPSALLFNQITPGRIENQSLAPAEFDRAGNSVFGLRVADGQNLLLVGGEVVINGGGLNALGGRVELGGVANGGKVEINGNFSLDFPAGVAKTNISLDNGASIDVAAEGGGAIAINAQNINLSNSILFAGIAQGLGSPNAQAGNITLKATDAIAIAQESVIANFVGENATGDAGNIQLAARSASLRDGSQLITDTSGVGDGGLVSIQATENVELSGSNTVIFSDVNPNARGNAGGISIKTGSLSVKEGAFLLSRTFGQGNAGDININAQNSVAIAGTGREDLNDNSPPIYLSSAALSTARGNSGNINIKAGSFSLTNFAAVDLSNLDIGNGNAGNLAIEARDSILISESGIVSLSFGIGNAGNIVLKANEIATERDSFIGSSNLGQGNSGNISFQARSITMKDPFIRSQIVGTGEAGDITLIAEDTILLTGERTVVPTLTTTTVGSSSGGDINLRAREIFVLNNIFLDARSVGEGDGGNINLDANTIQLNNSLINASAYGGAGKGGRVRLNATESVDVSGRGLTKLLENLLLPVLQDPNFARTIDPDSIDARLFQGIITATFGTEEAGTIEITTDRLNLREGALITTATLGRGKAGNVILNASEFLNVDGGVVSTSTITEAQAGDVEVNTSRLSIERGGRIVTTTLGSADGGDLIVNASNSIEISGTSANGSSTSGLGTGAERSQTTGNGGNLTVSTPQLTIRDGAEISASTTGQGNGGNILIEANSVNLSNGAEITVSSQGRGNAGDLGVQTDLLSLEGRSRLSADTVSGQGGNIQLQVRDRLLLRNNSSISTTAGSEGAQANGGNIGIDTNFVIAVPSENSDITANAFEGEGGLIQIAAQGVFGIEARQRLTTLSDITAFSQQNPQLNSVISVNSSDADIIRQAISLPATLVDVTRLVAQRCSGGQGNLAKGESEFIVSGRGGLPPQPSEALRTPSISVDNEQALSKNSDESLVEVTGWTSNEQGKIVLVAEAANEIRSPLPSCHGL